VAQYEGLVASLATDGKAEVVIKPGTPGIVGAPELTGKVCHCASDGSSVTVDALNGVGAGVGDVVSVTRTSGRPMRNAALLLGIPVLGGVSGFAIGLMLFAAFAAGITAAVLATALGLVLGIVIGGRFYRRVSENNQFVVTKIVRTRSEMASLSAKSQSALQGKNVSCDGCSERCL